MTDGATPAGFTDTDRVHMERALTLAREAAGHGDVPIGAVVARDAEVLGEAGNEREKRGDPTAHAEVLAIREASDALGGWRLPETTLYVTLEPCAMCAGAISLARIPRLVFAAADPKGGAAGGVIDLYEPPASSVLNHRPAVEPGLLAAQAGELLDGLLRGAALSRARVSSARGSPSPSARRRRRGSPGSRRAAARP